MVHKSSLSSCTHKLVSKYRLFAVTSRIEVMTNAVIHVLDVEQQKTYQKLIVHYNCSNIVVLTKFHEKISWIPSLNEKRMSLRSFCNFTNTNRDLNITSIQRLKVVGQHLKEHAPSPWKPTNCCRAYNNKVLNLFCRNCKLLFSVLIVIQLIVFPSIDSSWERTIARFQSRDARLALGGQLQMETQLSDRGIYSS